MSSTQNGAPNERSPLLSRESQNAYEPQKKVLEFTEDDEANPRNWSRSRKYSNVAVIAIMAVLSPLASAMFNPSIPVIAEDFSTSESAIVASTTGFLVFLGIGPLILAPLSETFGRRILYLSCFSIFALLQIPIALSPNIECLIIFRSISGFFGSVGIANGGGTLSDMFVASERARILGYYLLGPLLGPAIGPLFGGLINEYTSWRWTFGGLTIICTVNTLAGFFFLKESYAQAILAKRKAEYEKSSSEMYCYAGEDDRKLHIRLLCSMQRPLKILFLQPIVFTMAVYQAILYGTMYTLYTGYPTIFGSAPYSFSSLQVGLLYLAPGLGSLISVLLVPLIDTIFNLLTKHHHNISKPEFRLPLANLGSILVPASLLWFGWCIDSSAHWAAAVSSMPFFTIGQQVIFSAVQNYYIDAFEKYAASAIAAGAVFRAVVGGIVPAVAPSIFEALGYGWSFTLLAGLSAILAPAPPLFYRYGPWLRERFAIEL